MSLPLEVEGTACCHYGLAASVDQLRYWHPLPCSHNPGGRGEVSSVDQLRYWHPLPCSHDFWGGASGEQLCAFLVRSVSPPPHWHHPLSDPGPRPPSGILVHWPKPLMEVGWSVLCAIRYHPQMCGSQLLNLVSATSGPFPLLRR